MVDILHDHIAQGQPLLSIIRFFIHFHNAFAMLLQSAEATGQGGFSSSVMTDHCDNARLWQRKTVNIQRIPLLCISKMKVLTFDRTTARSEEHTSELQSRFDLVCRLLLE